MSLVFPPFSSPLPANFKSNRSPKSDYILPSTKFCGLCRESYLFPSIYQFQSPKKRSVLASARDVDAFTKYSGYIFELGTSEAEYLTEYNLSKIASIYRRKPFIVVRRLLQISTTLGRWFGLRYIDTVMERSDQMFELILIAAHLAGSFWCSGSELRLLLKYTEGYKSALLI